MGWVATTGSRIAAQLDGQGRYALHPLLAAEAAARLASELKAANEQLAAELDDGRTTSSELLQAHLPGSRVVKAFTIYGFENFEDNAYPGRGVAPVMLFCGDDAAAKAMPGVKAVVVIPTGVAVIARDTPSAVGGAS